MNVFYCPVILKKPVQPFPLSILLPVLLSFPHFSRPKITNFYKCTFLKVGRGLHLRLNMGRGFTLFKRNTFKCFAAIFLRAFFLPSCAFKHSLAPILLPSLFIGMFETCSFLSSHNFAGERKSKLARSGIFIAMNMYLHVLICWHLFRAGIML